jgi:hypothetical protein
MQTLYHPNSVPYTGAELRSHWLMNTLGTRGDAIAAFVGPCEVALTEMVDLEDVAANESIRSALMLHFIAEYFDHDLERMVRRGPRRARERARPAPRRRRPVRGRAQTVRVHRHRVADLDAHARWAEH